MTVAKSNRQKPSKPYPSFPLNANTNGQWSKRIRGKLVNFGTWDNPESALAKYKSYILDWDAPAAASGDKTLTLRAGINLFLSVHEKLRNDGDHSPEHFDGLHDTLVNIVPEVFRNLDIPINKLSPEHFRRLKERFRTKLDGSEASPSTMLKHIRHVKLLFSWLVDEGKILNAPSYGARFSKLSKTQKIAKEKASDSKSFTIAEIQGLLNACDSRNYRLKAMILLGLNGGMGPRDIAELTLDEVDLDDGWIESRRSKNGIRRCFKLWPETVEAIKFVLIHRFEASDVTYKHHVFITRMKQPYLAKGAISRIFGKLKIKAEIEDNGVPRGFYVLRHVCQDLLNQVNDDTARRWIVGHKRSRIEDEYTRTAPKDRIGPACDFLRVQVFGVRRDV